MLNLDKDDLFRNAAPGYVFFVVVMSFYAVATKVTILNSVGKPVETVILFLSGFPIGFVIHGLYRIAWHRFEIPSMNKADRELFRQKLHNNKTFEKFVSQYPDDSLICENLLVELINKPENEHIEKRVRFLFSYVHSLGACSLAMMFALLFVWFVKYVDWAWFPIFSKLAWTGNQLSSSILSVLWLTVALIFILGRLRPIKSQDVAKKVFLSNIDVSVIESRIEKLCDMRVDTDQS